MKNTFRKIPGKNKYERKELVMKLVRKDELRQVLGEAVINLSNYAKCL